MAPLTREQRSLFGKMGAHSIHSRGLTNTGPATAAAEARFEKLVDPDGVLEPEERCRRAEHARSLHFAQIQAKSAAARRAKAS
jgi:hypothetical protein